MLFSTLKRKCRHFDEIFITGCTGSCQNDNFQCSQWWKFRQNEDISVSVIVDVFLYIHFFKWSLIDVSSLYIYFCMIYSVLDWPSNAAVIVWLPPLHSHGLATHRVTRLHSAGVKHTIATAICIHWKGTRKRLTFFRLIAHVIYSGKCLTPLRRSPSATAT